MLKAILSFLTVICFAAVMVSCGPDKAPDQTPNDDADSSAAKAAAADGALKELVKALQASCLEQSANGQTVIDEARKKDKTLDDVFNSLPEEDSITQDLPFVSCDNMKHLTGQAHLHQGKTRPGQVQTGWLLFRGYGSGNHTPVAKMRFVHKVGPGYPALADCDHVTFSFFTVGPGGAVAHQLTRTPPFANPHGAGCP